MQNFKKKKKKIKIFNIKFENILNLNILNSKLIILYFTNH